MELPQELIQIISQFSKPITKSDWRKGSAFERQFMGSVNFIMTNTTTNPYEQYSIKRELNNAFEDLIDAEGNQYGENRSMYDL
jgi:hypothetical protein